MESVTIEGIKKQLAQLQELHAGGVLSQGQYDEARLTLERRLVEYVLSAPTQERVASQVAEPAPLPESASVAIPAIEKHSGKRPGKKLLVSMGGFVLLLALAGYAWKGSPAFLHGAPAAATDAASGTAPHTTSAEQIAAMTDKLVARLKEQPNDFEGWAMLARTYGVVQRHADALKAYEKALALRPDDAALLADYADTLAVTKGGELGGEPLKALQKSLKIDPTNLKALALMGTFDFNNKNYTGAVKWWEKLVQTGPADNFFVQQIVPGLAEARRLAGLPPPAQPLDSATQAGAAPAAAKAANPNAVIAGTVRLAPALAKQVQAEDTVFITARAAQGGRMPLAVMRRQVKDLPLPFTLDDSQAMSPSNALSSAKEVIVTARISKSGNAMPQAGDWQGVSGPVKLGSRDLKLEIHDPVKP
jgi:cytochrome c-type biogenesis protein CcmH